MEIVSFTSQDQEATAVLIKNIYKEMRWDGHPITGIEDLENFFHLPDDGTLFFIKNKNKIVGTGGWIKFSTNDALLKRFFIAKDLRGSGIAEELFQKLVSSAKNHQMSRMLIDVSKDNARATHFFGKNGFKQIDRKPIDGWDETKFQTIFNYYSLEI